MNTLQETFWYKSALCSFSLITVWLCNFFGKRISAQKLLVNVNEINNWICVKEANRRLSRDGCKLGQQQLT